MLHSAFWVHGAGELELSDIWAALIRASETADGRDEKHSSSQASTIAPSLFLDFLYPSRALQFIRQCSAWKSDRQEYRGRSLWVAKSRSRLYTSIALDGAQVQDEIEHNEDTVDNVSKLNGATVDTNIELEALNEYDEAWQHYKESDAVQQRALAISLLYYLSISERMVDAHRAIEVFNSIEHEYMTLKQFGGVISAYLRIGDVTNAIKSHAEAFTKFKDPVGTELIMSHLIEQCQWQLAQEFWVTSKTTLGERRGLDIWKKVDHLPNLADRALKLAAFVGESYGEVTGTSTSVIPLEVKEFAVAVVMRALVPKDDKPVVNSKIFSALFKVLQSWGADTDDVYEKCILQFVAMNDAKLAIQTYRWYRERVAGTISQRVLEEILKFACKYRNTPGLQEVLDDWTRFYGSESPHSQRSILAHFAAEGEVDTVKALTEHYFPASNSPATKVGDLIPLLHAHARRGEISEVVRLFEGIKVEYGVEPSIRIWNILINAYGRVGDVDGAFQRFEELLSSPKKPDDYTFGTMMGICTRAGDLDEVVELFELAQKMNVSPSCAMVNCLVLGHIQEDRLHEAEKICEDASRMNLKGSLTRMWNYMITAYAMRRDLENTNRLLRRMEEKNIDFDSLTYSALMQVLCTVGQPDSAAEILKNIMPAVGILPSNFHYAVLMGGYIRTGELEKVFEIHSDMKQRNIKSSVSTRLMAIKAAARQDERSFQYDMPGLWLERAERYFLEAYTSMQPLDAAEGLKKGIGHGAPVAYESAYFDYMIFVYGRRSFERVQEIYSQYLAILPPDRQKDPPIKILSALMISNLAEKNYLGVQQCWDLAFRKAKQEAQRLRGEGFLESHRYRLSTSLMTQMVSLFRQRKDLPELVDEVLAAGFALSNKNWNLYVQLLTKMHKYKDAFKLCESMLMDKWTGWPKDRWKAPMRNRLPMELRIENKQQSNLRAFYQTLFLLSKAYKELTGSAMENREWEATLVNIERECPKTVKAVQTMYRTHSGYQRYIEV